MSLCEYCKEKEVDAIIMLGGKTMKICSPECMDNLIKESKIAVLTGDLHGKK